MAVYRRGNKGRVLAGDARVGQRVEVGREQAVRRARRAQRLQQRHAPGRQEHRVLRATRPCSSTCAPHSQSACVNTWPKRVTPVLSACVSTAKDKPHVLFAGLTSFLLTSIIRTEAGSAYSKRDHEHMVHKTISRADGARAHRRQRPSRAGGATGASRCGPRARPPGSGGSGRRSGAPAPPSSSPLVPPPPPLLHPTTITSAPHLPDSPFQLRVTPNERMDVTLSSRQSIICSA